MGDFREPNGVVLEVPSSSSFSPEVWARAEHVAHEIIGQVQPTIISEERRRDVVDYVQRLLKNFLGCEVFPFGSVPLKTYLPDGDIDLTAFCGFNLEEALANDVFSVLEAEDHNPNSEFVVKDVQFIRAEVKLVKCLVQNIVVDISFNQIGGLCALCFLEEVDRLIGKDHLFKRSIILIKAWCYYESRILGAHHGLISTYALETLVLYIFHLFHSSLSGPLAVLHKFLEYFSNFEWEKRCVSLNGALDVKSVQEVGVEKPESNGGDLLLSEEFMRDCVQKFSVPSRGNDTNYRTFVQKHLNIVDPLKENNNLGRSVSKGNFFRIKSAFTYGARKLGQILLQPQENIAEEVRKFFTNTLDRHGKGQRPDVQDHMLISPCNGFSPEFIISRAQPSNLDNNFPQELSIDFHRQSHENRLDNEDIRHERGTFLEEIDVEHHNGLSNSTSRFSGDINDVLLDDNGTKTSQLEENGRSTFAKHSFENGTMENGDLHDEGPTDSSYVRLNKMWGPHTSEERENSDLGDTLGSNSCYSMYRSSQTIENHETMNFHPDLSGDVDIHLENLRCGRWWFDHGMQMTFPTVHLTPPPVFQHKNPWDTIRQSIPFRRDVVPQINGPRSTFFPVNPPVVARGTGMYFPVMNHHSYKDRSNNGKGRSQGQLKSPRMNGRGPTPMDRSPKIQSPGRHGGGRPKSLDFHESSPRGKVYGEVNGFVHNSEKVDEFSSSVCPPIEVTSQEGESCGPVDSIAPSPRSQNGESVSVVNNERLSIQSYRLKDEEDFPPLSV